MVESKFVVIGAKTDTIASITSIGDTGYLPIIKDPKNKSIGSKINVVVKDIFLMVSLFIRLFIILSTPNVYKLSVVSFGVSFSSSLIEFKL
ncbi:hypothetical protein MSBR2_1049 [Methanosarcina barkeri 227]|uniref:Uncharacterized protein n=1 Tax=Methanosarcina barkeri 227 TaxID=1434106 RepID=A0A0E3QZY0_METBA|nr:hypothetical protein MSBR2_1049 [Methanosarcina barkeri 227]